MKAGESRIVRFTYDESIGNPQLVGTSEAYDIELLKVYENVVPELTDEFSASLGEYTDLADLRQKTRSRLEQQSEYFARTEASVYPDRRIRAPAPVRSARNHVGKDHRERHRAGQAAAPGEQIDEEALRGRIRPDAVRSVQTYLIIEK